MSFENLATVEAALGRLNTITFDGVTARLGAVEAKLTEVKTDIGEVVSGGESQLSQLEVRASEVEVELDKVAAKEAAVASGLAHGPIPTSGFLEPAANPLNFGGPEQSLPTSHPPPIPTTSLTGRPGLFGDTYSPEQLNRTGRRFDPEGGGGNAFAAQLGDFATLIEFVFGPDNFFAHTIRSQIPYLVSGAKSPAEVRLFLEAAFTPFIAGIQQEIASPQASSQMRGVAGDLLRLIAGGNVGGATLFPTLSVGPGTTPPPTATPAPTPRVAGIAPGPVSGTGIQPGLAAVPPPLSTSTTTFAGLTAQLARISDTVVGQFNTIREEFPKRIVEARDNLNQHFVDQGEAVLAHLRQVQSDVNNPSRQQRVLDRLAQVQNDFRERLDPNHLFNPLIEGELRPMRREIAMGIRALGQNQLSPQALRDELERLNISGRLGVS